MFPSVIPDIFNRESRVLFQADPHEWMGRRERPGSPLTTARMTGGGPARMTLSLHSVSELVNIYNPRPERGSSVFPFAFVAVTSLLGGRTMPCTGPWYEKRKAAMRLPFF